MLHYQKIARTDLEIFPIVLGSVGVGKEVTDAAIDTIIRKYLDLGGNVIDTARMYTNGESEHALGRWLQSSGRREEIVLITKGGHPRLETMHTSRMGEADMRSDLEESLSALHTDYIDLYFYHRDDPSVPVGEHLELMEKFVREGKIRYYGCSNWCAERIEAALAYSRSHALTGFVANQMLFNLGSKYMKPFPDDTMCALDQDMRRIHQKSDILAMPYFGVCSGFFHILREKGPQAVKNSPYYTAENLRIADKVFALAEERHTSITAVLLRFFLVQDFPCCPLYGPTTPEQLDDISEVFDAPIQSSDYQDL